MKIPEEILKGLKKEYYPKLPIGGQSVGIIGGGITLYHEELCFSISVGIYRSQLKNLELAMTFFELFYEEYIK